VGLLALGISSTGSTVELIWVSEFEKSLGEEPCLGAISLAVTSNGNNFVIGRFILPVDVPICECAR